MSRRRLSAPRYRRRILGVGLVLAGAAYSVGAPIYVNRIEVDLDRRVAGALADAGVVGATVSFDGQDGELRCTQPVDDYEAAVAVAEGVHGVRTIEPALADPARPSLGSGRNCKVNLAPLVEPEPSITAAPAETDATTTDGTVTVQTSAEATEPPGVDFSTIAEAVTADPQLSYLKLLLDQSGRMAALADPAAPAMTLLAPTDAAFEALPADLLAQLSTEPGLLDRVIDAHLTEGRLADGAAGSASAAVVTGNGDVRVIGEVLIPDGVEISARDAAPITAALDAGSVTLTGTVASEAERTKLVNAARIGAGSPEAVIDQLVVDPSVGIDPGTGDSLARLVAFLPVHLVSGEVGFASGAISLTGTYLADADGDAMRAAAAAEGVDAQLEQLPPATIDQAAQLEDELNQFVAANPIRFESGSSVLADESAAVLDELAARLAEVPGVTVSVEGHTDSEGDPGRNLTLSQQRADAVRAGLIERGLDQSLVTATGFGITQPVLVDGVEDKDASRRVEFRIATT